MMKISIIDHVGKKAGMDYYSGSLAKGFADSDCQVSVFSNFCGVAPERIDYHNTFDDHSDAHAFKKMYRFVRAVWIASLKSMRLKTDIVILHLFSTNIITFLLILIPKLFGLRTAVISHDVSSFADNDSKMLQKLIYNYLSDNIIVHNAFSKQALLNNITLSKPEKVHVIKHGGYLDHIGARGDKAQLRQEMGLAPHGKYILFFGQIKKVKGLDILIEAMSKVPSDIQLIIAGKPWKDTFDTYDDQISKLGLSNRITKMIRFIEDAEREKLFFAADVNALPYRVIYQSGVLLMAMSHGLPVIASDLPPNKEIIHDGENGLLFRSESSDDLAKKIEHFFSSPSTAEQLVSNALITIESDYSWHAIAAEYISMLGK